MILVLSELCFFDGWMKPLLIVSLLYLIIVPILVSGIFSTMAQVSNEVNGIIKSDTVWSKANSPYD